jgi:hypothetical protein
MGGSRTPSQQGTDKWASVMYINQKCKIYLHTTSRRLAVLYATLAEIGSTPAIQMRVLPRSPPHESHSLTAHCSSLPCHALC